MMRFCLRGSALCLIAALLFGCSSVAPWERGHLAKMDTALSTHGLRESYRTHVHMSRESAAGATGEGVGGCGCY